MFIEINSSGKMKTKIYEIEKDKNEYLGYRDFINKRLDEGFKIEEVKNKEITLDKYLKDIDNKPNKNYFMYSDYQSIRINLCNNYTRGLPIPNGQLYGFFSVFARPKNLYRMEKNSTSDKYKIQFAVNYDIDFSIITNLLIERLNKYYASNNIHEFHYGLFEKMQMIETEVMRRKEYYLRMTGREFIYQKMDYPNFFSGIKVENWEQIIELRKNYAPNRKYSEQMYQEFGDIYGHKSFNQDEAAISVLENYGFDPMKYGSFIKCYRDYVKNRNKPL